jgi:4-hydroxybenzoate polyprenyltransferase
MCGMDRPIGPGYAVHSSRRIHVDLLRCIKEARPSVLGIHLLRFAAGAAIGAQLNGRFLALRAGAGAAVWELAIFSIYLLNGIADIKEDRVNGSRRPIAAGTLSRRTAAWWAAAAALAAVAGAAPLGAPAVVSILVVLALGWQYSAGPGVLKRRPAGTAAVGAGLGFLAYFMGFSGQGGPSWPHLPAGPLVFFVTMSAWMAFVGAPAKDLPDAPGDAAAKRRTLAVAWGEPAARRVVAAAALVITVAFGGATVLDPALLDWPAIVLGAGALAIIPVSLGWISVGEWSQPRMPYQLFMLTQYAVNLCLLIVIAK